MYLISGLLVWGCLTGINSYSFWHLVTAVNLKTVPGTKSKNKSKTKQNWCCLLSPEKKRHFALPIWNPNSSLIWNVFQYNTIHLYHGVILQTSHILFKTHARQSEKQKDANIMKRNKTFCYSLWKTFFHFVWFNSLYWLFLSLWRTFLTWYNPVCWFFILFPVQLRFCSESSCLCLLTIIMKSNDNKCW